MRVTVYDNQHKPIAGDPELSESTRELAIQSKGYVVDDETGVTVFVAGEEGA